MIYLLMWFGAAVMTASLMAMGFRLRYGGIAPYHRLYLVMALLFWPIMLLSVLLTVCRWPNGSAILERLLFGWLAYPAGWWVRRQLRKNSVDHSRG